MRCAIDQLNELLVFEAVDDTEKSISRAGCGQRIRTISVGKTGCETFPRTCGWLAVPTEELSNDEPNVEQHSHEWRRRAQTVGARTEEILEGDSSELFS